MLYGELSTLAFTNAFFTTLPSLPALLNSKVISPSIPGAIGALE